MRMAVATTLTLSLFGGLGFRRKLRTPAPLGLLVFSFAHKQKEGAGAPGEVGELKALIAVYLEVIET
jgi:hypothetical protein